MYEFGAKNTVQNEYFINLQQQSYSLFFLNDTGN